MSHMQDAEAPALEQLIYISAATHLMSNQDLTALLIQSRRSNSQMGVSGMLVYSEGSFIQVLEGTKEAIESTFARIQRDSRHHHCQVLLHQPITERLFDGWYMGFESISTQQLQDLSGSIDFFGDCPIPERGAAAFQLLSSFRSNHDHHYA